ncbi:hypothetical protein [uncultured Modestobacter sp.]|uniref:hypothetical protein n=1 Tax=uncultured Modestobacter sp. TaxID=380048 RepID=UPI002620D81D|nr:hypothetical protein [uncultured Modestobacter sp.]
MRRALSTLLLGCAVLLAGWVAAPPAAACSCAAATTLEQFEAADVVFTGTLLSREVLHPPGGVRSSGDPALHVFTVDSLHKGAASAEQPVVSADSGASCGLELRGDGPFLVFATDPADAPEGQLAAGLCGGTTPLTPELAAEVESAGEAVTGLPSQGTGDAPAGVSDGAPAWTGPALQGGTALLALLAGVLAVRRRRRLERRATVVVLTRD